MFCKDKKGSVEEVNKDWIAVNTPKGSEVMVKKSEIVSFGYYQRDNEFAIAMSTGTHFLITKEMCCKLEKIFK